MKILHMKGLSYNQCWKTGRSGTCTVIGTWTGNFLAQFIIDWFYFFNLGHPVCLGTGVGLRLRLETLITTYLVFIRYTPCFTSKWICNDFFIISNGDINIWYMLNIEYSLVYVSEFFINMCPWIPKFLLYSALWWFIAFMCPQIIFEVSEIALYFLWVWWSVLLEMPCSVLWLKMLLLEFKPQKLHKWGIH